MAKDKLTPAEIAEANKKYAEMNKFLQAGADQTAKLARDAGVHADQIQKMMKDYVSFSDATSAVADLQAKIVQSQKEGNRVMEKLYSIQQKIFKTEKEREKLEGRISKHMEAGLNNLTTFAKKIPLVGNMLSKHLEKGAANFAKELSIAMAQGESGLKGFASAATSTFGKGGILLVGVAALAAALIGVFMLLSDIDKKASDFAKSSGQSTMEAWNLSAAMRASNIRLERGLATAQAYNKLMGDTNQITAENFKTFENMLQTADKLQLKLGLSAEDTAGMAVNAKMMGIDMEVLAFRAMEMEESLKAQGVSMVNSSKVMKDIGKMSKYNAARFGDNADELVRAATAAQMLGSDINSMIKAGESMLDIESSLEKEMKARAMTGKDINFDAIRNAALSGNAADLMKAQMSALNEVGDLTQMNTRRAAAFADAMGMSKDEAVKMQQNMLLAQKAGLDMQAFVEGKIGVSELKAAAKTLKGEERARFDAMIRQKEATSINEEFNEALLDLKEALLPLMKPLASFLKKIAKMVKFFTDINSKLGGLPGAIMMAIAALKSLKMMKGMMGGGGMGGGGGGYGGMMDMMMMGGMGGGGGGGSKSKSKGSKSRSKSRGRSRSRGRGRGGMLMGGLMLGSSLMNMASGQGTGEDALMAGAGGAQMLAGSGSFSGGGPKKGIFGKIGGFFGKIGGKIMGGLQKLNPMNLLKKAKGKIIQKAPKLLKHLAKIPLLSTFLEGLFAHSDISAMIGEGMSKDDLNQEIGRRTLSGIGGVIGGVGAAAVTQALNILPGLGVLASPLAYMLGDTIGRWLGGLLADNAPGIAKPVGKFVGDTFYKKPIEAAYGKGGTSEKAEPNNTTVKLNDGSVEFNRNDKIGGVLDNKSTEQMIGLLKTMVNLLSVTPKVAIGDEEVIQIGQKLAARKTFT